MTEEKITDKQKYLLVWLCRESVSYRFFFFIENVYDAKRILGKRKPCWMALRKTGCRLETDRKPFDSFNSLKTPRNHNQRICHWIFQNKRLPVGQFSALSQWDSSIWSLRTISYFKIRVFRRMQWLWCYLRPSATLNYKNSWRFLKKEEENVL